ncbi:pilus assembly protein TadG-related protein [Alsobacter sp. SYSU M60028]|uniref:Pilus assembly protein TadG-related protein n=1 Tax=Alsobacter ponti TaxID=2962936 RepID=A0ABT1L8S8_9HYPH|nr:pilus assembly protein TadG-related protein [Alsobacter ponti]MCP8937889.1 pilus assembly protein TadG-related protein [Alsobacter ponti]
MSISAPRGKAARFRRDEKGAVLPLVAIMIVAIVGGAGMALDISRYYSTQSALQKAADAYALAAAAELDGGSDAITRATTAVAMMDAKNAIDNVLLSIDPATSVQFYDTLPASDDTSTMPTALSKDATGAKKARFVEVTVTGTVSTLFPLQLVGFGGTSLGSNARAVAGFTQVFCEVTPMYVCTGDDSAAGQENILAKNADGSFKYVGRQITLKPDPGSAQVAGNYGYLSYGGNGVPDLVEALGTIRPKACYTTTGVDTKTGNPQPAIRALNTRFDIYDASLGSAKNNQDYSAGGNVRKGYYPDAPKGNQPIDDCNTTSAAGLNPASVVSGNPPVALPLDSSMPVQVGNGGWSASLATYFSKNFPSATNLPTFSTRFEAFQYEITNGLASTRTGNFVYQTGPSKQTTYPGEVGAAACNPVNSSTLTSLNMTATEFAVRRRLIYAALIDCKNDMKGGKNTDVPVQGLARLFVLRPGTNDSIDAEFVGVATPNDSVEKVIKDMVQLYR